MKVKLRGLTFPLFSSTLNSGCFGVIHTSGFFGALNPTEGVIKFYLDIAEPKIKTGGKPGEMELDKITREFQVEIRMAPPVFMALAGWANAHIKDLEKKGILKRGKRPLKEGQTFRV